MTERFEHPSHDSPMYSHDTLVAMLASNLAPFNDRMRIVWGRRPELLLGGTVQFHDNYHNSKQYHLAINRYPWGTFDEAPYDVHVFNDEYARRYAVGTQVIYTAQNMGRLTMDSLIEQADPATPHHMARWLHSAHFSGEATDVVHRRLAEWDVLESPSELDTLYPDMGVYHYTEILKQEQFHRDE